MSTNIIWNCDNVIWVMGHTKQEKIFHLEKLLERFYTSCNADLGIKLVNYQSILTSQLCFSINYFKITLRSVTTEE